MSPSRLNVFFFCKLCGCYVESVNAFVEHQKACHFEEFQSCKCIVFEERAKNLGLGPGYGHGIGRDYHGTSAFSSPLDPAPVPGPGPASAPVIINENKDASFPTSSIAVIKNEVTSHGIDSLLGSQDFIKVESPKCRADETIEFETESETDENITHHHTTTDADADADTDTLPPNIFDLDPNSNIFQLSESQQLFHSDSSAAFIKTESFTHLLEPQTKLFAYENISENNDQGDYEYEHNNETTSKLEDGGHCPAPAPGLNTSICSLEPTTKRIIFENIKTENKNQENQNYRKKAISQNVTVQNRPQTAQTPYVLLRRLTVQEIKIARTCSYLVRDRGRGRDRGPSKKSEQTHGSNKDTSSHQISPLIAPDNAKEKETSAEQINKYNRNPHPFKVPNVSASKKRNKVPTRSFQCKQCLSRFTGTHNLNQHLLTHLAEKKWKCSVQGCDQTFKFEFNLQTHVLTHSISKA